MRKIFRGGCFEITVHADRCATVERNCGRQMARKAVPHVANGAEGGAAYVRGGHASYQ
jgi:hypothetical protein